MNKRLPNIITPSEYTDKDAHEFYNYHEWRSKQRLIVDIDLSKIGIPNDIIQELYCGIVLCMKYKLPFALFSYDQQSHVSYIPELLKGVQVNVVFNFKDESDMISSIKLACLAHQIIVIDATAKQLKQIKKQDADVFQYLQGRGILPAGRSGNN